MQSPQVLHIYSPTTKKVGIVIFDGPLKHTGMLPTVRIQPLSPKNDISCAWSL